MRQAAIALVAVLLAGCQSVSTTQPGAVGVFIAQKQAIQNYVADCAVDIEALRHMVEDWGATLEALSHLDSIDANHLRRHNYPFVEDVE